MNHTPDLLLLHLAQTKQELYRAKNNSYSDGRKEVYQDSLTQLFNELESDMASTLQTLSDKDIYSHPKRYLDFILKSLEFLNSSTLNQIPYEIVECLNHAMNDWASSNNYIIVTGLINDVGAFSFDVQITFDYNLYADIYARYNIQFDHRLVKINVPRAFSRDYLTAVVLYHELGHFIELQLGLMYSLIHQLLDDLFQGKLNTHLADLEVLLPSLSDYIHLNPKTNWRSLPDHTPFQTALNHLTEYYCDLFAAMYIGRASKLYVNYLTSEDNTSYDSHPATTNRNKVVEDFLTDRENIIVTLINGAVQKVTGNKLTKRFQQLSKTDFFKLVPPVVRNPAELHGLIHTAWRIWLEDRQALSDRLNTSDSTVLYSVINNLVEKAIGNFYTQNEWTKSNGVLTTDIFSHTKTRTRQFRNPFIRQSTGPIVKREIVDLIRDQKLIIRPLLDPGQIGEISIDFRLGYDFLVSIQGREAFINASRNGGQDGGPQRNINQFFQSTRRQLGETFILHPHQTVLAVSLEYVQLPDDCMLQLIMRSSYSRLGITVNTIAQPGYSGCLNIELTNNNNNPINLTVGSRIIQGTLCRVSRPSTYFHSPRKYVCQVRPEPSAVINDKDLYVLNELWKVNNNRTTPGGTP